MSDEEKARERFPILLIPTSPESVGYTSPPGFGQTSALPQRDRIKHAERLERQFRAAITDPKQLAAIHAGMRDGHSIHVIGADSDLPVERLEDIRAGIRLLNVDLVEAEGGKHFEATLHLPRGKTDVLLRKLEAYRTKNVEMGDKPRNQELVARIEAFRESRLENIWKGPAERLPTTEPAWIEAWIRYSGKSADARNQFRRVLSKLEIPTKDDHLDFPEIAILLIHANRDALERLIENSDQIAELHPATEPANFFLELENREQADWVKDLLARVRIERTDVSICILDTGINRGHPLIAPILAESDVHALDESWGTHDHAGHGTLMAGIAAYGDLLSRLASKDPLALHARLESAKILPPRGENPEALWGAKTQQGVSRAEIAGNRRRVVCMAITSPGTRNRGRPTSWSAAVDELAFGTDDASETPNPRLLLVSGGNADPAGYDAYPDSNTTDPVHDPAQSWNALTVGAFTGMARIEEPQFRDHVPLAVPGGLSPSSTTSLEAVWDTRLWPIKPEIVLEGGNLARSPDGTILDPDDLKPLSTFHDPSRWHFSSFDGTSAATASAAWMAARIHAEHPWAWPETVRGLLVHTAEWTDEMKRGFLAGDSKGAYGKLVRVCGWGVPDLERALYCLRNSLTLVAQEEIQPFRKLAGRTGAMDMHFHRLPWPSQELLSLGDAKVEMRITLSYYIAPSPGGKGYGGRYRYPSYGLRFKLNGPGEEKTGFLARINKKMREDEDAVVSKGDSPSDHWLLGERQRDVGSIHSDIWRGTAADLATSNLIAVHPTTGWWKDRPHLNRVESKTRYSLIVSIRTPNQDVDIYTPVANQIQVATRTDVPISFEIDTQRPGG